MAKAAVSTIGFTKTSAKGFFERLLNAGVKQVMDVRLHNTSQLAGFAKADDLAYFLEAIGGIQYTHQPLLAPTDPMLKAFKKEKGDWRAYEHHFLGLMSERRIEKSFQAGNVRRCMPPVLGSHAAPLPPAPRLRISQREMGRSAGRAASLIAESLFTPIGFAVLPVQSRLPNGRISLGNDPVSFDDGGDRLVALDMRLERRKFHSSLVNRRMAVDRVRHEERRGKTLEICHSPVGELLGDERDSAVVLLQRLRIGELSNRPKLRAIAALQEAGQIESLPAQPPPGFAVETESSRASGSHRHFPRHMGKAIRREE